MKNESMPNARGTAQAVSASETAAMVPHLLLGQRIADAPLDPFFRFQLPAYLPADLYASLHKEFPAPEWFVGSHAGGKALFGTHQTPEVLDRFRAASPLWDAFLAGLESKAFLGDLQDAVTPALVRARGRGGARRWVRAETAGLAGLVREQSVDVSFEFSQIGRGGLVHPHTDSPSKLVSLLMYFPDPAWRPEFGGGTVFYTPRDRALGDNWENRMVSFDALETLETAAFGENRLAGFVKSKDSYHAVDPIACPEGMVRNSLNINIARTWPRRPLWGYGGPVISAARRVRRLLA